MSYLPWILDGVILVVLIVFAARGAKRGLVLSLCSLLAVFIAFAGATVAARQLSPKLSEPLQPKLEMLILGRIDAPEALPDSTEPPADAGEAGEAGEADSVLDAIRSLGLYDSVIDSIGDSLQNSLHQAVTSAASVAAVELASSIAYLAVFVAAFLLILIAWKLLSHALDLVARLPVLHTLNGAGGALLGLLKGCILLFVIAWVIRFSGKLVPEEISRETILLKFFLTANPLTLISGF